MKKIIIATLISAVCLLMAAGCNTLRGQNAQERYNAAPLTVAVPGNLSPEQVQMVMARTLTGRGWAVTSSTPDEVVGGLDHRGFQAKAILKRDGSQIKILSDSTYYVENRDEWQPSVPYGWLENLQKDMTKNFTTASY